MIATWVVVCIRPGSVRIEAAVGWRMGWSRSVRGGWMGLVSVLAVGQTSRSQT